jgi:hypothetical protein
MLLQLGKDHLAIELLEFGFQQYFSYIVAVSFIGGGKEHKYNASTQIRYYR